MPEWIMRSSRTFKALQKSFDSQFKHIEWRNEFDGVHCDLTQCLFRIIRGGDKQFRALDVQYLDTPALCTDTRERQVMPVLGKCKKDPDVSPISVIGKATSACPGM